MILMLKRGVGNEYMERLENTVSRRCGMCLDPAARGWGNTEFGSLATAKLVLQGSTWSAASALGLLLKVAENPSGRTRETPRNDF